MTSTNLIAPKSNAFQTCSGPSINNCAPFRTISDFDNIAVITLIDTFFGLFDCTKVSDSDLTGKLYFNVYMP